MKKLLFYTALSILLALGISFCIENNPQNELDKKSEKLAEAAKDFSKEVAKTAQETGADMKDAAKDVRNDALDTREAVRAEIKSTIADINNQISSSDRKMKNAAKEQQETWARERKNLVETRDQLNDDLKGMGSEIKDGWKVFVADVRQTMKKVKHNLDQ